MCTIYDGIFRWYRDFEYIHVRDLHSYHHKLDKMVRLGFTLGIGLQFEITSENHFLRIRVCCIRASLRLFDSMWCRPNLPSFPKTHRALITPYRVTDLGHHSFRYWPGACCLTEPVTIYCQLKPWELTSVQLKLTYKHLNPRKRIWKFLMRKVPILLLIPGNSMMIKDIPTW